MRRRGFTLIELLVVISIIALLSSVVLASLNTARAKARDAKRLSDLRSIQVALEQYYADNGRYPASTVGACNVTSSVPNSAWCNSVQSYSNGRWIAGGALAPYIPSDPIDPMPDSTATWGSGNDDGGTYFYFSWATTSENGCGPGQFYILVAGMEISSNAKKTFRYCNGATYTSGGSHVVGNSVP